MGYSTYETSSDDAYPIELYYFTYSSDTYLYTSSQYDRTVTIGDDELTFYADYIERADALSLNESGSNTETTTVTVSRTNSIALLYQGAPPEDGTVNLTIYRYHKTDTSDVIIVLKGIVSQASFKGSTAELTITLSNSLTKQIPRGTLSYYCQNCLYDSDCGLTASDWGLSCAIDGGISGLWVYSTDLTAKTSGYFTNGYIKMGNCFRSIVLHEDNGLKLKYPVLDAEIQGTFTAYPSCNALFLKCHSMFKNTDNFTGIPYCKPINAVKNRTGYGSYWVDNTYITRDSDGYIGKISGV